MSLVPDFHAKKRRDDLIPDGSISACENSENRVKIGTVMHKCVALLF